MKNTFIATFAVTVMTVAFTASMSAQVTPQPEKSPPPNAPVAPIVYGCPKLDVKTSNQPVREGMPVKFTATMAGADPKAPATYDWYLSAGIISRGQGTPAIEVSSIGAGADRAIVANLLVGGFPPECVMSAASTAVIAGPAQKIIEYGLISDDEEKARLDHFYTNLDPNDIGYILGYAGRKNARGFASDNLRKIRTYLLKAGVSLSNLVFVDGGYREEPAFEFWLVPKGAEPPRAAPTVSPKEIVFPKKTPARGRP